MKKVICKFMIGLALSFIPSWFVAQTNVRGYVKKDGTYVAPHVRSDRNTTNHDNYSSKGNSNPYTGATGTKGKDYTPDAYNYGSGKSIQTGSRGGQYYINSNGNKTYAPKK